MSSGLISKPMTAMPFSNNVLHIAWPIPVVRAIPVTTATFMFKYLEERGVDGRREVDVKVCHLKNVPCIA